MSVERRISGGIAGTIVGLCIGMIITALKGWNLQRTGFGTWNDRSYHVDQEAWAITICLGIIGVHTRGRYRKST